MVSFNAFFRMLKASFSPILPINPLARPVKLIISPIPIFNSKGSPKAINSSNILLFTIYMPLVKFYLKSSFSTYNSG